MLVPIPSLFKSNQDLQAMFLKLSKLQLSGDARDNGELAAHAEIVMGILDEAILSIENLELIKQRLTRWQQLGCISDPTGVCFTQAYEHSGNTI